MFLFLEDKVLFSRRGQAGKKLGRKVGLKMTDLKITTMIMKKAKAIPGKHIQPRVLRHKIYQGEKKREYHKNQRRWHSSGKGSYQYSSMHKCKDKDIREERSAALLSKVIGDELKTISKILSRLSSELRVKSTGSIVQEVGQWGTWMAQSGKHWTLDLAQVMISGSWD